MIGAVYAFLGIGLVLVYRTARILNLAHGESFAITGVAAAVLAKSGLPLGVALALAILIAIAFALSLHRFVLRPRAEWPPGTLILITLGAAFVVRGVLILVAGTDPVSFPVLFSGASLRIAGGVIPAAISGMSPVGVVFGGLGLGLFESWVGAYLGALYQDPVMFGLLIAVALWQARNIRFGGTRRA